MRQKRAKAYRKLMSLYSISFGFRQPYQVLIDSHMSKEAVTHKIDLVKQLGAVLQGTVKPLITQCSVQELYDQEKEFKPAVELAKTFERRRCNHRQPIPGDECLSSVVGETNKHRYVLATQSQELRQKLRAIPAVPIVHFNRSVMILAPPSDATLRAKALKEEKALHPSEPETTKLTSATATPAEPPRKKKKGPKGPNPLSVKKKKPKPDVNAPKSEKQPEDSKSQVGEKRRRDDGDGDEIATQQLEGVGHKRKRRRKHGQPATTQGEDVNSKD
ncbi:PIN domain-like protein [Dichomitus squalens]|uniref:U three protein 23 n=1 Tax=Dichomitus squalens TaxID=114155 RepID=A0A4Q9N3K8_9APHY|nr:PIN domain-like protein [Dichomitus squalens]